MKLSKLPIVPLGINQLGFVCNIYPKTDSSSLHAHVTKHQVIPVKEFIWKQDWEFSFFFFFGAMNTNYGQLTYTRN